VSTQEKIPDRLKRVRKIANLTQEELARELDFTRSYISQIESGNKEPGERFLRDLARFEARLVSAQNYPVCLLREQREKNNLSQKDVAKKLGIDIGVYQAIEGGHGKCSERLMEKICTIFPDLEKEQLMAGIEHPPRVLDESGKYGVMGQKPDIDCPEGVTARYVPLISWAQAGTMGSFTDEAYQFEAHIAFNVTDRRAIAVQVRGDSMRPPYDEGDIVILYPSSLPHNGDLVIARLTDNAGGDVMFKIFSSSRESITLSSYNPAYPPLIFNPSDFAWIYPAASIVKNLRR
jgi:transcriptional regulator with XRE-family HTH domain